MKLEVAIEKRHLFLFAAILVGFLGVVFVVAVNPTTKPNPGHYSQEVNVNVGGVDKSLQAAIDAGDFGGGWPAGSYCIIQAQDQSCPAGFTATNPYNGPQSGPNGNPDIVHAGSSSALGTGYTRAWSDGTRIDVNLWAFCCKL